MKSQKIEKSIHPLSSARRRSKKASRNLGPNSQTSGTSKFFCFRFLSNTLLSLMIFLFAFSFCSCDFSSSDNSESWQTTTEQNTSTNDNGTGQSSGGSTTVQTPEETNSTSIESGSIVDTETGVTYYFTKTTTTNLNVLLTAKTSIMSAASDLEAYIKTDGTIEIKKDVAEAVTASIKTSLYKDEVIKNTKWYKDEKHTDLASEKAEINEVESTS